MNKNKKSISIKDIAELSGVSIATVSRVLNHKQGGYSKKTEEKIQAIAKSYGYVSNMAAKTLRQSKSNTIGLIVPNISNDFFSTLAYHIENYMFEQKYSVFICNSANQPDKEIRHFKSLVSKGVEGIICIGGMNELGNDPIMERIPIVCIDRYPKNRKDIPIIVNDDRKGGYIATEYLIKKGCKNILFIGSNRDLSNHQEREEGYCDALKAYGRICDKNYILYTEENQPSYMASETSMNEFLKQGFKFDAVFASNDQIALGVLNSLKNSKVKIPEDVRLIGFDNSLYSKLPNPGISTIRRYPEKLSENACKTLLNMVEHKSIKEMKVIIPVDLVERESSR